MWRREEEEVGGNEGGGGRAYEGGGGRTRGPEGGRREGSERAEAGERMRGGTDAVCGVLEIICLVSFITHRGRKREGECAAAPVLCAACWR